MWVFMKDCSYCGATEERVFTDNWTGKQLCLSCLATVAMYVTNSPATEGDNLMEELKSRVC